MVLALLSLFVAASGSLYDRTDLAALRVSLDKPPFQMPLVDSDLSLGFAPIRNYDLSRMGASVGSSGFTSILISNDASYACVLVGDSDGGQLFAVDLARRLILADPASLAIESNRLTTLAKTADGSMIAASGPEGEIFLISTKNWSRLKSLGFRGPVKEVAFTEKGEAVLAKLGTGEVLAFDTSTGQPVPSSPFPATQSKSPLTEEQWSEIGGHDRLKPSDTTADKRFTAVASDNRFKVIDLEQMRRLKFASDYDPDRVISQDGKRVAKVLADNGIEIVSSQSSPPTRVVCYGHPNRPRVVFTPDGKLLYSVSVSFIKKWDSQTGELLAERRLPEPDQFEYPRMLGFSKNADLIYIGDKVMSFNSMERAFGISTDDLSTRQHYPDETGLLSLSEPNEKLQVVSGQIVSVKNYTLLSRPEEGADPVRLVTSTMCFEAAANADRLAFVQQIDHGLEGPVTYRLAVMDWTTKKVIFERPYKYQPEFLRMSPNGKYLSATFRAKDGNDTRCYSVDENTCVASIQSQPNPDDQALRGRKPMFNIWSTSLYVPYQEPYSWVLYNFK